MLAHSKIRGEFLLRGNGNEGILDVGYRESISGGILEIARRWALLNLLLYFDTVCKVYEMGFGCGLGGYMDWCIRTRLSFI